MGLLSSAVEIGSLGMIDPGEGPAAAGNAAAAQAQALNRAITLQRDIYEQGREDLAPFRATGTQALGSLSDLFLPGGSQGTERARMQERRDALRSDLFGDNNRNQNLRNILGISSQEGDFDFSQITDEQIGEWGSGPVGGILRQLRDIDRSMGTMQEQPTDARQNALQDFFTSPGYEFRLDQGTQAIERSNAARGRLDSGASLKDLTQFGQGIASQEFNNYANRLASLAGVGQSATNAGVSQGANFAAQQGNLMGQLGNARASGYVGAFNANPLSANNLMGLGSNILGGMLAGG